MVAIQLDSGAFGSVFFIAAACALGAIVVSLAAPNRSRNNRHTLRCTTSKLWSTACPHAVCDLEASPL